MPELTFRPANLTDAEIARIGDKVIAILKEEKLSVLEVKYLWVMIYDRMEKELK